MSLKKTGEIADLYSFTVIYHELRKGATEKTLARTLADAEENEYVEVDTEKTANITNLFRRLENRYGLQLKKESQSTFSAGEDALKFYRLATRVISEHDKLLEPVPRNHVYISTIDIGAHFWIPEALHELDTLKNNRDLCLHMHVGEWWQVLQDVRDGVADFGIATSIPDDSLQKKKLIRSPHRLVVAKSHHLHGHNMLGIESLASETVVCMHTASGPVSMEYKLRWKKIFPQLITVDSASQVFSWIARGECVGILPECLVEHRNGFKPIKLSGVKLIDAFDMLYTSRERCLSHQAKTVYKHLLEYWHGK